MGSFFSPILNNLNMHDIGPRNWFGPWQSPKANKETQMSHFIISKLSGANNTKLKKY